ncbi:GNAT family N-acetyltransferase [Raoultibacter phocaeensis]|uniref:GNAT family N-acetyltransferase n=1 Tax=Raoultibacter phocaeensis TaxID=2479841 RepID=UPI0015D5ADE7|nr:GNAT family N-acetyltransferase [Raoultibacter phocaeensis]
MDNHSDSTQPPCSETDRLLDPVSTVPRLTTERLVLRAFCLADADDVFAYSSDPRIGHDAGWPQHRSLDDSRSFITDIASQGHVWAIIPRETATECNPEGTVIGSIGLIPDPARSLDSVLMLGYAIGSDWWGRGFTTEAAKEVVRFGFEQLGLIGISCTCYPWNAASRRVIEKCGFSFEGTRHLAEIGQDGVPEDLLCHLLAKEAWEASSEQTTA